MKGQSISPYLFRLELPKTVTSLKLPKVQVVGPWWGEVHEARSARSRADKKVAARYEANGPQCAATMSWQTRIMFVTPRNQTTSTWLTSLDGNASICAQKFQDLVLLPKFVYSGFSQSSDRPREVSHHGFNPPRLLKHSPHKPGSKYTLEAPRYQKLISNTERLRQSIPVDTGRPLFPKHHSSILETTPRAE